MKKLYRVSVEDSNYDQYDSFLCAADSPEEAAHMHPYGYMWDAEVGNWYYEQTRTVSCDKYTVRDYAGEFGAWPGKPDTVKVEELDLSNLESGVLLGSFNAG